MATHKYSIWGATSSEEALVVSMLKLSSGRTVDEWLLGDINAADLVLFGSLTNKPPPPGAPHTVRYVASFLQTVESNATAGAAPNISRAPPLRFMPLLELLNEASNYLNGTESSPSFADTSPSALEQASTMPPLIVLANTLSDLLKNAAAAEQPTALLRADGSLMAIIYVRKGHVAAAEPLKNLIDDIENHFWQTSSVEVLSKHAFVNMTQPAQSLEAFCWKLGARCAKQHGLLPWLANDAVYKTTGWPDFGAIGVDRVGLKLASELASRAMTIAQLAEKTQLPLAEIMSFINSASVSGLLSMQRFKANQAPIKAIAPNGAASSTRISMFARLRSKLGLS